MSKDSSSKKADKPTKSADSKSDKSTSADKGTDSSTSDKSGSGATAKGGSSSRPISYFSSVATDEYREGWANIFGKPAKNSKRPDPQRTAKPAKKSVPKSIRMSEDDLDADLQALLREALKKRARKDKLGIGRQLSRASLSWNIEVRIDT